MNQLTKNEDVVITSRIRLARNIKKYPFTNKLSEVSAKQLIDEVRESILSSSSVLAEKMKFFDLRELSLTDKMALMESRVISQELLKKQMPCAVMLYEELGLSIMINEEDHLRIQCVTQGMDIQSVYDLASKVDDTIEEKLDFAYNEKYGYLTSCPTNLGTGLRASYMLHVPALEAYGQLQIILQAIGKFGITVRGMYGEGTESAGSVFQISNQITLGLSEEDIIDNLNNITKQIVDQERKVREKLLKESKMKLADKVYRSYGILSHARVLTSKEAMTLLSDVKLGFELGILKTDQEKFNIYNLMTSIQPANLQKIAKRELKIEERDTERAKYIRENLTKIVE